MHRSFVILAMLTVGAGPTDTLAPWGKNPHPTDAPKRHVEKVTVGRHAYVVRQVGTMDGTNCRSPSCLSIFSGGTIRSAGWR
jgi:hypothetical protein